MTKREDDIFLKLLQEEHELLKMEKVLANQLRVAMENETQMFNMFSQRLRDAHLVKSELDSILVVVLLITTYFR